MILQVKKGENTMNLNVDQIRIVNNRPNGHVLVKGVAGSGKTTVAVSKISMLINDYMDKDDAILFVTYNKTLIKYTKYLINDIGIQQNIFFDFDMDKQLRICTIDSIISYYGAKLKPERKIANSIQMKNAMLNAIAKVKKKYYGLALISSGNYQFLREEVEWLKSCSYIEREVYLNVDRIGRMSRGDNRYRLLKNSAERNAIFDIYECYDNILDSEGVIDYKTNALRVLDALKNGRINPDIYRHVIVDESQDLTRVQLEIVKYLYNSQVPDSSIMFIADVSQSIYTQSWLSGQSFKSIGFDMSGKSNILSKNYRTTYEIAQAAYSLIEKDDSIKQNDIFVKPVAIDRHGDMPCYKHYLDIEQEGKGIADRIKELSKKYGLKDIVVAAANRVYLENIKDILIKNGVETEIFSKADIDFDKQVVRLYTLHSVKGLEFPVIFIAGINQGTIPYSDEDLSIGRRLLYVGMTRAKHELYLSSQGAESVFIKEMDLSLFRNDYMEFTPLYKVDISDYLFKEKINDINSREEIVRQWFLKEMITKLNYPQRDIDVEYPVQRFSERGFVDIVAFQYESGKREPYILVEIKQPGENMDRAMKELMSYAFCCPTAKYLAVTDGRTTDILNIKGSKYIVTKNLPAYNEPEYNIYTEYEYVNRRNKKHFLYMVNNEDKEEIIVKDIVTNEALECGRYQPVNVIGRVAAGVLKYANTEKLGNFLFPDLFLAGRDELFILEVTGDSMVDFQIYDGDYVLIKKQNYAENGDIVVAGKRGDNQVTLKQFCNFNGTIGLMPGNRKYSPIMIPEKELFINGVLEGVLNCKKMNK